MAVTCRSPGIAARTLANIADVLAARARGRGGLRSGPAGNRQWSKAFQLLEVRVQYIETETGAEGPLL